MWVLDKLQAGINYGAVGCQTNVNELMIHSGSGDFKTHIK